MKAIDLIALLSKHDPELEVELLGAGPVLGVVTGKGVLRLDYNPFRSFGRCSDCGNEGGVSKVRRLCKACGTRRWEEARDKHRAGGSGREGST